MKFPQKTQRGENGVMQGKGNEKQNQKTIISEKFQKQKTDKEPKWYFKTIFYFNFFNLKLI